MRVKKNKKMKIFENFCKLEFLRIFFTGETFSNQYEVTQADRELDRACENGGDVQKTYCTYQTQPDFSMRARKEGSATGVCNHKEK